MSRPFHILDVFAEQLLAGNPLAVVSIDGDEPSDAWMLSASATATAEMRLRSCQQPIRLTSPSISAAPRVPPA